MSKAANCYLLFCKIRGAQIREAEPKIERRELSKKLSAEWRSLPQAEKELYKFIQKKNKHDSDDSDDEIDLGYEDEMPPKMEKDEDPFKRIQMLEEQLSEVIERSNQAIKEKVELKYILNTKERQIGILMDCNEKLEKEVEVQKAISLHLFDLANNDE